MSSINFFADEIEFILPHEELLRQWINDFVQREGKSYEDINYIFCSDYYLLEINKEYLQHDYYTDIITFDNRETEEEPITSDIFISIDRVQDNAETLNTSFSQELHRVMIHGILHLLGQGDKTEVEKKQMREREEASLSLLQIPKD